MTTIETEHLKFWRALDAALASAGAAPSSGGEFSLAWGNGHAASEAAIRVLALRQPIAVPRSAPPGHARNSGKDL